MQGRSLCEELKAAIGGTPSLVASIASTALEDRVGRVLILSHSLPGFGVEIALWAARVHSPNTAPGLVQPYWSGYRTIAS